ncbi:MAG: SDR family NAD(P)-dependent oxidoreductase [Leptospiraceae bacterium]|nr:SDR family NAD(P)-dependent oxidoreductase [Leptospiraceae bacterium]
MKELKGKIALVTGASQGIGKAIGERLAKEGCKVFFLARGEEALKKLTSELNSSGLNTSYRAVDASNFEKLRDVVREIEKQEGRIDILVNNAGLGTFKPMHLSSFEELLQPVHLPYAGALVAIHTVITGMLERKSGHIVNLTSPAGYFPFPNMMPYTSARHAMVGLSLSLFHELEGTGVGVSLLCPGEVNTGYFTNNDANMNWYPRISKFLPIIEPVVVAEKAVYAIKNNKSEIIFPWILWFLTRFTQTFPYIAYPFLKITGLWKPSV